MSRNKSRKAFLRPAVPFGGRGTTLRFLHSLRPKTCVNALYAVKYRFLRYPQNNMLLIIETSPIRIRNGVRDVPFRELVTN